MRAITVDSKAPAEIVPIGFDFANLTSNIDSVIITLSVILGTDVNVATMTLGGANINGTMVTQLIRNGLDGLVYSIRADIVNGAEKYALILNLPITELG